MTRRPWVEAERTVSETKRDAEVPSSRRTYMPSGQPVVGTRPDMCHGAITAWVLRTPPISLSGAVNVVIAGCGVAVTLPFQITRDPRLA